MVSLLIAANEETYLLLFNLNLAEIRIALTFLDIIIIMGKK